MKRLNYLFVFLFSTCIVSAQEYVPTKEDIARFKRTKTMVVLEHNPLAEYNQIISEVIGREWALTEIDFITKDQFEEKRYDPGLSFLITTPVAFKNDNTEAKYKFLHLLLGGDYLIVNQMPTICSVPVAYHNVDESSYIYKFSTLLRFVQNHIQLMTEDPSIASSNVFKHYNSNIQDIKSKTLYIVKSELAPDVNSIAKIKKVYPYKFKIATPEEIEEKIVARDADAVFLHKVGPEGTHLQARCYKIIMGAEDSKIYYFDYHMVDDKKPDGLLGSDFKKLVKK